MSAAITDDYTKIKARDVGQYRSMPIMTRYEFDQVIALRTMHLSRGAPPMVDVPEDFQVRTNMELRSIAIRELKEGRLPYFIKRPMPNAKPEYWKVSELSLAAVEQLMR